MGFIVARYLAQAATKPISRRLLLLTAFVCCMGITRAKTDSLWLLAHVSPPAGRATNITALGLIITIRPIIVTDDTF